jgi:hypothetical protein
MDKELIDAVLLATDGYVDGTYTITLIVSAEEWDAFEAPEGVGLVIHKSNASLTLAGKEG